jgi:hypothetical protein
VDDLIEVAQSSGTTVLISAHQPLTDHPGLRQLRIDNGRLDELERDAIRPSRETYEMLIELAPTVRARDLDQIVSTPGVTMDLVRQPENVLVLRSTGAQADRVLAAAIAQGWSVRSVQRRDRSEPSA